MKKAFTTTELIVAIALLAIAISICGGVFGMAVKSHRQAVAVAEITRNFRAITDQINRDFAGLIKDGFLAIRNNKVDIYTSQESEDAGDPQITVRIDNLFYFSIGDFQSMLDSDNKSNISLTYLGHPKSIVVMDGNEPYSANWTLVRNNIIILPEATSQFGEDYMKYSLSEYISDPTVFILDDNLKTGPEPDFSDPQDMWQYFSAGVGSFKVEWSVGSTGLDDKLCWMGLDSTATDSNNYVPSEYQNAVDEDQTGDIYTAEWGPKDSIYWPYALKFTMTLYDSKGVLTQGKTFTHIVYIGD